MHSYKLSCINDRDFEIFFFFFFLLNIQNSHRKTTEKLRLHSQQIVLNIFTNRNFQNAIYSL